MAQHRDAFRVEPVLMHVVHIPLDLGRNVLLQIRQLRIP